MEERVRMFYELHNNKWFHIMNFTLEIIKTKDNDQKTLLIKYGACFFETQHHPPPSITPFI